ncbi:MAG: glycosyltransferase family 4 protein [Chryseolinea sp.]
MTRRKKVLFLVPYPIGQAPSQRFRFEQYFQILRSNGIDFSIQSFLDKDNWRLFYSSGDTVGKVIALIKGFIRRSVGLARAGQFDFVFIHREASPIGPPVFEWILAKLLRKKIIFDFDDAIWMTDKVSENPIARLVKYRGKFSTICKVAHVISAGNQYLCDFARQYNDRVILNPTTIDTESVHSPARYKNSTNSSTITIGWTGSHSTLKYLETLKNTLQQIEGVYPEVEFTVIADKPPTLGLKRINYKPWSERTEIEDLASIDIGLMPLPMDEWSKGKCGFKILQYMALCIPSVSSPVGVNTSIVDHHRNGFLASSEAEWVDYLSKLIASKELRLRLGEAGRETVTSYYSVSSNTSLFLSLFE